MKTVSAKDVAAELRKLADHLDLNPLVQVAVPDLYFWYGSGGIDVKETFLANSRILPRPVEKSYPADEQAYSRVRVSHKTSALNIETSIYRESVCTIIKPAQPAEYDCVLTLLDSEDAELEASNV